MECNKDEAARAKEIAEKKFLAKDIAGAKKFALKAQNLFPGLEGIPQLISSLDVYISAENKICGEADWYGILDVNPQADEETVRKQYRKLALMLHPDKNKSIGADGAFKLISAAWSLLSDKVKRAEYDRKRNVKVFQKASTPAGASSTKPASNGFYKFTRPSAKVHKSARAGHSSTPASPPARPPAPRPVPSHSPSHKAKPGTFWTVCLRCKMQYEYLRIYLNNNLLCPNCHEPFLAVETAPPPSTKWSTPWNFSHHRPNSNHRVDGKNTLNSGRNNVASTNSGAGEFTSPDSCSQTSFKWGPFSKTGGASTASLASSMVQQAYEKVKRDREEAQAATKREDALKRNSHASKGLGDLSSSGQSSAAKRRKGMEDVSLTNNGSNMTDQMGAGFGAGTGNVSGSKQGSFETGKVNGITKPYSTWDAPQFDIQTLLMDKAKAEIGNKVNEWKSSVVGKTAVNERMVNKKAFDSGGKISANPDTHDQEKAGELLDSQKVIHCIKSSPGTSGAKTNSETLETMSINVPDPDFHDFDKDRTENCFGENQIWAAYDHDNGMPRYYAMVHNVVSLNPFRMRISWLNSKTNTELAPLNWIGSGFTKTCGDFRIGKYEIYNSLNSFSHKVRWTKGTRGAICVYPKKGDVWALYRNWSPDWNELTEDEVIHKYDMVEVLEDYNEKKGATVTPLVKVAGFKAVFHRHLDPREVRRIPREEMFRFSHHVPSCLLTGQEGPNAPKGYWELDPAATPPELLQEVIDVKEEIVDKGEILKKEKAVDDVEKVNDESIGATAEKAKKNEKEIGKMVK